MMTVTHDTDINIVELDIDGEITPENFDETLTTLRAFIGEQGNIRLLKLVRSIQFPPIPMSKLWDDLKFVHEHLRNITHIDSVTDVSGVESMVKLLNPMFKAEVKHFKLSDLDQAREWLKNS